MNKKLIRVVLGLMFIVLGTINIIRSMEYIWVGFIAVGIVYIYKGIKSNED